MPARQPAVCVAVRGRSRLTAGIRAGPIDQRQLFFRLPRTRSAGSWTPPEPCETACFPRGGRVGHGCAGSAIARETDVGENVGGGRGGSGHERADGATLAERRVAVDGEVFADVADAGGPVRRGVGVGGGAQLVADTDGRLQVLALFKALCRRYPGRFQPGQLRTLQRRVREWRVQDGPDREVYFEQVAVPGREAAFDFTDASDLGVTIRGVAFPHLLFEWVLSYSKWTYVALAVSETFEALVAGLQGALWTLGAVPALLRHDNLSAATHELKRSGGRQLTARFQQVMDHYGLDSSRIQPGKPHENGVAEQAHFRTKTAIEQALLLRGDRDFADESAYLGFVRGRRRGAEPAGGGSAGRGAFVSAAVAGGAGPGVHDVPVPGAQVEHDSHRQPDLLGAVAPGRSHGRGSSAPVDGRDPLRRPGAVHDAASSRRGGTPDRLSPHHRQPGPQAGGLCPLPLPRGGCSRR